MRPVVSALAMYLAVLLAGCGTYHTPPRHILAPNEKPEVTLKVARSDDKTVITKFLDAYDASYDEEGESSKARTLTRYGMTLVDTRCDLFFEQIGRGAQRGDFIRREFQSITAALIAALGLTAVGQDAITGVGIGSALGIQTLDNYSTVYFFSPDVSAVQKLVRTVFNNKRAEFLSPERSPKNFEEAIGALRTYQNICTAHEIKRMVTEAIDPTRPPITRFGEEPSSIYAAAKARALVGMREAMQVDNIDFHQAVLLELLIAMPADALKDEEVDYACSTLSEPLRNVVCRTGSRDVATAGPPAIDAVEYARGPALNDAVLRKLEAGWATLRALVPVDYEATRASQQAAIASATKEYREKIAALTRAEAEQRAGADKDALIKELNGRIDTLQSRTVTTAATTTSAATPLPAASLPPAETTAPPPSPLPDAD